MSVTITVGPALVVQVVVTASSPTIGVNSPELLLARPLDANNNVVNVPITWRTSDVNIATVSSIGLVTGHAPGGVTISATAGGVTGSVLLTVSANASTFRFAYALATNPTTPSYTALPAFAYNSSGGEITIDRMGQGDYTVTFVGQETPGGQSEILLISSFGFSNGSCKVYSWRTAPSVGLVARVLCYDFAGTIVDDRFSIMLLGSDFITLGLGRFAFALGDQLHAASPYNPSLAHNNSGGTVSIAPASGGVVGSYNVTLAGNARPTASAREAILVNATSSSAPFRCNLGTYLTGDQVNVRCFQASGPLKAAANAQFAIALLEHGRIGLRGAFVAATSSPVGSAPIPAQSFSSSSSPTPFSIQRSSVGRYDVRFTGLARQTVASTEGVQIVVRQATGSFCKLLNWQNTLNGVDLIVSIQCYKDDGTFDDNVEYGVLVLQ